MRTNGRWLLFVLILLVVAGAGAPAFTQEALQGLADPRDPVADRWRILDAQGVQLPRYGSILDPYNQNPLKGDFPWFGNNTFGVVTLFSNSKSVFTNVEGVDTQFNNDVVTALELFHGSTVFRPKDWSLKAAGKGIFNRGNDADVDDFAVQELFGEAKLVDIGPNYDFASARGGVQFFKTDFNGLIFQDFNLGGALFGELSENSKQFNAAFIRLLEKENGLLTFETLDHDVIFANLFVEDIIKPGFKTVWSVHVDRDQFDAVVDLDTATTAGVTVETNNVYVGFASAGHLGRIVFSPAAYFVFGEQTFEGVDAADSVSATLDVSAFLAGVEVAYPHNYMTYRAAAFVASGDSDPNDDKGNGFAAINENINLFGGGNSFVVGGAALTKPNSFIPSNQGGASQFDNPGMLALNAGLDMVVTPKLVFALNGNLFRFLDTATLGVDADGNEIDNGVGFEVNGAFNYRVFLNENFIIQAGANLFVPQDGGKALLGSDDSVFTGNVAAVFLY